ncbi:hypothetical protein BB560_001567 [Smittium megazygosporum]|uniref:N-acetyltransferase ESCO acetyl-transferase domain-containing protein n=1 Tax=Smittium megazygosporum TaxID=133381 RepID=A0A2T9ZHE0_9FUNG|nr:hypothetical protein BB560_001567 [Smittium megazygosporum]
MTGNTTEIKTYGKRKSINLETRSASFSENQKGPKILNLENSSLESNLYPDPSLSRSYFLSRSISFDSPQKNDSEDRKLFINHKAPTNPNAQNECKDSIQEKSTPTSFLKRASDYENPSPKRQAYKSSLLQSKKISKDHKKSAFNSKGLSPYVKKIKADSFVPRKGDFYLFSCLVDEPLIRWPKLPYYKTNINSCYKIIEPDNPSCQFGERIIKINCNSKKAFLSKAVECLNIANTELGAFHNKIDDFKTPDKAVNIFLYLSENRNVIGCLFVEKVSQSANLYIKNSESYKRINRTSSIDNPDLNEMLLKSLKPSKIVYGINRVWTARTERRRHIALMLIEAFRFHFIYGTVIDKSQIAFSQTTSMGDSLAKKFAFSDSYLTYSEN